MMRRLVTLVCFLCLLAGCGSPPRPDGGDPGDKVAAPQAVSDPGARAPATATPDPPKESTSTPAAAAAPAPERAAVASIWSGGVKSPTITALDMMVPPGQWQPAASGATYPAASVWFRFHTRGDLSQKEFSYWFGTRAPGAAARFRFSETEPGLVEVEVVNLPPVVPLDVAAKLTLLYFGEAPALVALNLTTGAERRIVEVPADVSDGSISPDGRWAAIAVIEDIDMTAAVRLINLKTGEIRRTPMKLDVARERFAWFGNRLFVPFRDTIQEWDLAAAKLTTAKSAGTHWGAVSMDGRYLAGLADTPGGSREAFTPTPATLVARDLQSGTERSWPGVGSLMVRSCFTEYQLAWEADGKTLLVEEHLEKENARTIRFDPATGQGAPGSVQKHDLRRWEQPHPGPQGWQVTYFSFWGALTITSPTGETFQRGKGLALGWLPTGELLLIRWPNAEYRLSPNSDC